jgi:hypothetical protein
MGSICRVFHLVGEQLHVKWEPLCRNHTEVEFEIYKTAIKAGGDKSQGTSASV